MTPSRALASDVPETFPHLGHLQVTSPSHFLPRDGLCSSSTELLRALRGTNCSVHFAIRTAPCTSNTELLRALRSTNCSVRFVPRQIEVRNCYALGKGNRAVHLKYRTVPCTSQYELPRALRSTKCTNRFWAGICPETSRELAPRAGQCRKTSRGKSPGGGPGGVPESGPPKKICSEAVSGQTPTQH